MTSHDTTPHATTFVQRCKAAEARAAGKVQAIPVIARFSSTIIFGLLLCACGVALLTAAILFAPIYVAGIAHGDNLRNAALVVGAVNAGAGVALVARALSGTRHIRASRFRPENES